MDKLKEFYIELEKNLKKSKDRIYSSEFKLDKLCRVKYVREKANVIFEALKIEETTSFKLDFDDLCANLLLILNNLATKSIKESEISKAGDSNVEEHNSTNMAQFDLSVLKGPMRRWKIL